ncbi:hypothetical protein L596_008992 [Steinernema carpocapsae]|uniref:Uncharacterized protein n=1 Tax=Steinernema carpocapsae TaxID=34508 RepID=A0A4U5PEB4_STECR|nr:hypothetical protein L596_008992 [Steinernema carpocapsae]
MKRAIANRKGPPKNKVTQPPKNRFAPLCLSSCSIGFYSNCAGTKLPTLLLLLMSHSNSQSSRRSARSPSCDLGHFLSRSEDMRRGKSAKERKSLSKMTHFASLQNYGIDDEPCKSKSAEATNSNVCVWRRRNDRGRKRIRKGGGGEKVSPVIGRANTVESETGEAACLEERRSVLGRAKLVADKKGRPRRSSQGEEEEEEKKEDGRTDRKERSKAKALKGDWELVANMEMRRKSDLIGS